MSEQPAHPDAKTQVQAHLHAISQLLRQSHRLDPETQVLLANLMDELGNALDSTEVPSDDVADLTEGAAQLVQAVHEEHEPGLLEAAEERLERAVAAIEFEAPALAALTRRLADMLSNLGI